MLRRECCSRWRDVAGTVECGGIAKLRLAGFVLWHCRCGDSGNLGRKERIRLHPERRIVWADAFLASIVSRAHFISPADEFRPNQGSSATFAVRRLGITAWSCSVNHSHTTDLVGFARQSDQRSSKSLDSHRGLRVREGFEPNISQRHRRLIADPGICRSTCKIA